MLFKILIKLNFILILIYWKKILYLENFSTQNQQPTFYMRPLTTHVYFFFYITILRIMYISTWPACCQNIQNFCHWVIIHLLTVLWNVKKLQIINITACLKYHKHKTKRNLQWNNRSWQSDSNVCCWNISEENILWQIHLLKYYY